MYHGIYKFKNISYLLFPFFIKDEDIRRSPRSIERRYSPKRTSPYRNKYSPDRNRSNERRKMSPDRRRASPEKNRGPPKKNGMSKMMRVYW